MTDDMSETKKAEPMMVDGWPRRGRVDLLTPAERAIYDAIQAVEEAGAHVRLTDAVTLLSAARNAVADAVEAMGKTTPAPTPAPPTAPTPRETGADIDRMTCPKCGYGGSAMHHDPSGDNWRICASCGADWDADPTPRPDAASASVTEAP